MSQPLLKLSYPKLAKELPPRVASAHKGLYGHVLLVGGDAGHSGAILMAAMAALRVGAGLVSIATRMSHAAFLNVTCPEIMCHGVESSKQLQVLIERSTVIVVGPGLGLSAWAKKCWRAILKSQLPMVVDADALNLLSLHPNKKNHWILTPHAGEAARLLKKTPADIQNAREQALVQLQKKYGGTVVLKGAGTLILGPCDKMAICLAGNPGMASGGMGDVLSGVIGGLVAQSLVLEQAAKLGVMIHALAGDRAAKAGERGLLATDLCPYLRELANP